ncbi:uncharacterized protein LOC135147298 [Daucus carota subsp. sativus]|uniref:uncharacterized protein LOC108225955 n=1 Tax=Daucus carota subsp. sativus TaxID=79200 RepID=UPI0007EF2AA6|nr:PREDICTED: uncharacterized protein LOC108225955 [Daucus carota subsp. sativus]
MRRTSYANVVINGANDDSENTPHDEVPNSGDLDDASFITSNGHPLYLQNVDHPGLVLISKKLTGTENFGPWKRSLSIALSAKNKLGLLNGSVPMPDAESPLRAQWERVNDMVISWILNTVSEEISNGMDFVNTAQEVWEELTGQFSSIDGHRIYQILKDLHALEQGDKSVEIYYHKMKNLWDEYVALEPTTTCKCSAKCDSHLVVEARHQRKRLLQFIIGLNDSFSNARGQILMMDPLPSITQAYSLVKQEEKQRQKHVSSNAFLGNVKSDISTTSPTVSSAGTNNVLPDSTSSKK